MCIACDALASNDIEHLLKVYKTLLIANADLDIEAFAVKQATVAHAIEYATNKRKLIGHLIKLKSAILKNSKLDNQMMESHIDFPPEPNC